MKARTNFVAIANDIGASDKAIELQEDGYLAAIGLYLLSVCYCDRQRSDGYIPMNAFRRVIAPGVDSADLIDELVRVGFLEERDDGWSVSNYLEWQRSKSEIEAAIEQRRAAGRNGGKARAAKTRDPEERDKTDRPTESSPLALSLDESPSEPPSEPTAAAHDAEQVRSAAGNKLTASEATGLIERYGKERTLLTIRAVLAKPPAGGIKNMAKLLDYRLEHGDGEPVAVAPRGPRRVSCPTCSGSGRGFDPATGEDTDIVCPVCLGDRYVDA